MIETGIATACGELWVRRWPGPLPPLVALHGFSLHGGMFGGLATQRSLGRGVAAPDLPGHGRSRLEPVDLTTTLAALETWLAASETPAPVLGYSQGGRIALHLAHRHRDLVSRLVIVSASPGLSEPERQKRRTDDERLARSIEEHGLAPFLDGWLADPLTGTSRFSASAATADRRLREENTPSGLAAALRGLGQGLLPTVDVAEIPVPVLWVAGSLDTRYVRLAQAAAARSGGEIRVIQGCGHNVVGERPVELASIVASFINGPSGKPPDE